jgi:uncharacterized protein (TIGR03084 family)
VAADVTGALAAQHRDLAAILEQLAEEDWNRPTRCDGWSVRDVILHLAQTDEMAVASLEGRVDAFLAERTAGGSATTIDEGAALMVQLERGGSGDVVRGRWAEAAGRLDALFDACDPHMRVTWVAGTLSVHTLAATRLSECWIHTGDVADAVGAEARADDRLRHVARLAWRTIPYAFARAGRDLSGSVGFELVGPSGETWSFGMAESPATVVRGNGVELCLVAARRMAPSATGLEGSGPDGEAVLELVRTYA